MLNFHLRLEEIAARIMSYAKEINTQEFDLFDIFQSN